MRTANDEHELPVISYEYFADRDLLTRAVMDRMLAGVLTRKFARVSEPVGQQVQGASTSTGKSTVSELFIEKTRSLGSASLIVQAAPGRFEMHDLVRLYAIEQARVIDTARHREGAASYAAGCPATLRQVIAFIHRRAATSASALATLEESRSGSIAPCG